ncbi:MAG: alpha-E domain-containing protein [Tepidisphaeraceae bacterium]|jgi:uncharacterized alpha-E superfamily protein
MPSTADNTPARGFTTMGIASPPLPSSARPMLARDADAMYWMARYVERAEHVARLLLVNANVLIDMGDLAPAMVARQWQSILTILRLAELPEANGDISIRVAQHLTIDADNPNSIVNCITRARENARGIRENISAEMWEHLNALYWSLRAEDAPARFEESPDSVWRSVMTGSMLFQGLTDQTLAHDQRWLFAQLGKYLERIDVTCRIIQTKFDILKASEQMLENTLRNIHWMAVLRSCCAIEAYRRNHVGDMDPFRVAGFLILEPDFPRSVRFSVRSALASITAIRSGTRGGVIDPAERILGRLDAQLEYAEIGEIVAEGLGNYLQRIQSAGHDAALAVQQSYFLL